MNNKLLLKLSIMLSGVMAIVISTWIIAACDGMHSIGFNCGTLGIGLLLFGIIAILSALAYVYEMLEAIARERMERED